MVEQASNPRTGERGAPRGGYDVQAMALPPEFDEPAFRGLRRVDRALGRGQARVFRVLWFAVPPESVLRDVSFQALLASRFFSDIALQALLYASLIQSARDGEGTAQAALLGVSYELPGVLLGLYGGVVADAVPKRVALVGAYLAMAALAFLIAAVFGTGFGALLAILFSVRVLHQVTQPSEASAVPLVASHEALASATSALSFAGSAGEVVGKALLAPLIVRAFGVEPVSVLAGLFFLMSASRVFQFRPAMDVQARTAGTLGQSSTREALRWLFAERAVMWMLLLAALASTINSVLGVLAPKYVQEALGVDPAFALYVFAPASIGLVVALVLAPLLIRVFGERPVAAVGFVMVAVVMAMLGLIGPVTDALGWVLIVDVPGIGRDTEMAGFLALFMGAGLTFAAAASQTYVSRTVPLHIQGRTFAVLGVLKDGLSILPLLGMGLIASVVGVEAVLTVAPFVLIALAFGIDHLVGRWRRPSPVDVIVGGDGNPRRRRWRR